MPIDSDRQQQAKEYARIPHCLWALDLILSALALIVVLGGLVIEVIYALLRATPEGWWLWASAFMILFSVVLANRAPVLIFPIFFKFTPLEDTELAARLTALAARANTRVRGVYTMMLSEKTTEANAALMGQPSPSRALRG